MISIEVLLGLLAVPAMICGLVYVGAHFYYKRKNAKWWKEYGGFLMMNDEPRNCQVRNPAAVRMPNAQEMEALTLKMALPLSQCKGYVSMVESDVEVFEKEDEKFYQDVLEEARRGPVEVKLSGDYQIRYGKLLSDLKK